MLTREEYVEQAYFFRTVLQRMDHNLPMQELLEQIRNELLATTRLPMAIDLLLGELKHKGAMAGGMKLLKHYFTAFQTYLVEEAEHERGRFDFRVAIRILQSESEYKAEHNSPQGLFFYQLEAITRNRLSYDRGIKAMAEDPLYDADWSEWILSVRRQLGIYDLADLIYGRSQEFADQRLRRGNSEPLNVAVLFGLKEGKIAWANRGKEPLYLFSAMQRHLDYPSVPRLEPIDLTPTLIPQLIRRMESLESRIKMLEEEQRRGLDITKFYAANQHKAPLPPDDLM